MNNNNYGFKFSEIIIMNDLFIKRAKNKDGCNKLKNELNFYLEIIQKKINLSMPELIYYNENELHIRYINNSTPLTNIITNTNWKTYVNIICKKLEEIHNFTIEKKVDDIITDINIETYTKLLKRYNETEWEQYNVLNKIKYVNTIKIKNMEYYSKIINNNIKKIILKNNITKYNLIHGDTHLGNILLKNNMFYFIDPRGNFGNSILYGLKQYDYAKILFGISGYSIFDNMKIDNLIIENENINIEFIKSYEYIFEEYKLNDDYFDELTLLFALSIWLGNNNCFLDINKKVTSLMIAYYYCEKYLSI
jgi:hypothetical protein